MSCAVRALVDVKISRSRLQQLVSRSLRRLRPSATRKGVAVVMIGDRRMQALNARYRHQRGTTDVLSFPGAGNELGDIFISVPQAKRQAAIYRQSLTRELDLLVVHGLLHLLGYDHQLPRLRRRMERMEQQLLSGRSLIQRVGRRPG